VQLVESLERVFDELVHQRGVAGDLDLPANSDRKYDTRVSSVPLVFDRYKTTC
jgi:hypothetical protein